LKIELRLADDFVGTVAAVVPPVTNDRFVDALAISTLIAASTVHCIFLPFVVGGTARCYNTARESSIAVAQHTLLLLPAIRFQESNQSNLQQPILRSFWHSAAILSRFLHRDISRTSNNWEIKNLQEFYILFFVRNYREKGTIDVEESQTYEGNTKKKDIRIFRKWILEVESHANEIFGFSTSSGARLQIGVHPLLDIVSGQPHIILLVEFLQVVKAATFIRPIATILLQKHELKIPIEREFPETSCQQWLIKIQWRGLMVSCYCLNRCRILSEWNKVVEIKPWFRRRPTTRVCTLPICTDTDCFYTHSNASLTPTMTTTTMAMSFVLKRQIKYWSF